LPRIPVDPLNDPQPKSTGLPPENKEQSTIRIQKLKKRKIYKKYLTVVASNPIKKNR
jgi:hypothetical protein